MIIKIDDTELAKIVAERDQLAQQLTHVQAKGKGFRVKRAELEKELANLRARLAEAERWLAQLPCGHIVYERTPEGSCAICGMHESIRNWQEMAEQAEAERDSLRAEVEKLRAENAALRASQPSFGRAVACGADGPVAAEMNPAGTENAIRVLAPRAILREDAT